MPSFNCHQRLRANAGRSMIAQSWRRLANEANTQVSVIYGDLKPEKIRVINDDPLTGRDKRYALTYPPQQRCLFN